MRPDVSLAPTGVACTTVTVYTTFGDRQQAEAAARRLLDERLIACANLYDLRSLYRWEGAVQDEGEVAAFLKTEADRVTALLERLPQIHPYDLPCVEVWPAQAVHAPFGAWVRNETRPA